MLQGVVTPDAKRITKAVLLPERLFQTTTNAFLFLESQCEKLPPSVRPTCLNP